MTRYGLSATALRAASRVAWRQAKRAPGRSILVVVMIALPITALTLATTLVRTSVPTLDEHIAGQMGQAELLAYPNTYVDPEGMATVLPRGSRAIASSQWNTTEIVNGSLVYASVFEPTVPIDDPVFAGLYELMEGRAPTRAGEIAIDPRVEEIFDVGIGGMVTLGGEAFRVVGVAARPLQMWDPLFVTGPGTLAKKGPADDDRFPSGLLIDLPAGADVYKARDDLLRYLTARTGANGVTADIDKGNVSVEFIRTREETGAELLRDEVVLTGVSFAGTTVALFGTGLIVAAAFGVGVRRQLRALGMIGATGGSPLHVRWIVLLGGTTLGLVGSGIGLALGLGAAYAITPQIHRYIHALPGDVLLHWPSLIGAAVLGVAAATVAAAAPARHAVRISTLDALASRMPPPRPPGKLARRGLAVAAAGGVLVAIMARPGGNQATTVFLTAGIILMLGGFLVTVPLLVGVAGRFASRLPASGRIAVRETARNGRRTGTAIAAAALALTMPVGVAVATTSEEIVQRRNLWMGPDHARVGVYQHTGNEDLVVPPGITTRVREILPGAIVVQPRVAMADPARYPLPEGWDAGHVWVEGPVITQREPGGAMSSYRDGGTLYIGDAELLRVLHAEDGIPALEAGRVVTIGPGTSDEGFVHLTPGDYPDSVRAIDLPAVEAGEQRYYTSDLLPRYVIGEVGARRYGLIDGPGWGYPTLIGARAPITPEQRADLKDVASGSPGVYAETLEDFLPQLGTFRVAVSIAAIAVALMIVAVIVALVAAESRRDQAILVAVGATPRARRRIAGVRAGLVAAVAGVIAIPAGFAPVTLILWSRLEDYPLVVPWIAIGLVGLVVPLVAAAFGWLVSRAPKTAALLQPIA